MASSDGADTIIVGAGLAGAGLAWHLAGQRRIVVERAAAPGAEASRDGVGMVRRLAEDPVERALALRTSAWLRELPGEDWPAPPVRQTGAVVAAAWDPTWLADPVAHLRARGVRVEALDDPGEAAPIARGARLARAWWVPDELLVDPPALLAGFVRGAVRTGADLRCGVQALALLTEGDRVVGLRTDRGDLRADRVVLAAGAWTSALARTAGLERPLFPLRRSVLRAEVAPEAGAPWVWVDDAGLYARPTDAAWWVSSCDEAIDWPPGFPSRGSADGDALDRARTRIGALLPGLRGATLAAGWSGLRTFAPDRRPVLGPDPERPGLWWLAGLGGSGVTCGAAAAAVVADWIRGDAPAWLPQPLVSPARAMPRRWPIRPDGAVDGSSLVGGTLPSVKTA
ncbi:MAG: FAD-binding oxidoreductase [Myxococcota bacterium]